MEVCMLHGGSGIGGCWEEKMVSNIIINSGNISAYGLSTVGSGIGGGQQTYVGNIEINGGNIIASAPKACGIGSYTTAAERITINGGNITANGGEYGEAIGNTKNLQINGGNINAYAVSYSRPAISATELVEINGGNVVANSIRISRNWCYDRWRKDKNNRW